jgi:hypothetical protein
MWEERLASNHPNVKLKVTCFGNDRKKGVWSTMPDSGAQVSMAPMSILQDLGLDFTKDCEPTDIVI